MPRPGSFSAALAGVWALITASRIDRFDKPALKAEVIRWSTRWLVPSFLLVPAALLWYLSAVPESSRHLMQLGIGTIGSGMFTQVTRAALVTTMASASILAIVYFLAARNPLDFGLGHACAILFLALAATGATEHAREMIRKPYTVSQYIYSNGVRHADVDKLNQAGYRTDTMWNRSGMDRGELMFKGQCMNCHTVDGYRSLRALLQGRDRKSIANMVAMLHDAPATSPYKNYMPPLVGTREEVDALVGYLDKLENSSAVVTAAIK
jgi:cytochrome bd ubiquinol oxidase subunit I